MLLATVRSTPEQRGQVREVVGVFDTLDRLQAALAGAGDFRLVIDEDAPKHMISPQAVQLMLKEFAK